MGLENQQEKILNNKMCPVLKVKLTNLQLNSYKKENQRTCWNNAFKENFYKVTEMKKKSNVGEADLKVNAMKQ